ncbi:PREDICTED: cytochrome P450 3A41-like [Acropora digitifera]|uniref:cytochrome P450 3A41-like n=1 Tax=Acropora digitifera TaxID=70779 RepID=UPI00077AD7D1|nr:PREDICTED: cytochrome P450 3A41-like [Acropora digitifera]
MANLQQLLKNVSCSTWFAILLGLLALLYWFGIRSYNSVLGNSALPGPRIWPWVGNLPDLFKYGGFHKMLLNYFYKYGRVYKMCLGRSPSIVVTDPEIIKQITVKEFWKFPNRPLFVKPNPPLDAGLFAVRDETWRRIRNTLTPTFTASKLKQIVPIIDTASKKLTAKMQKCAEKGAFCILHERRKKEFTGSKDLVQLMLKAHEENENGVSRLSEDEIMAQSITFFLAGFQTTGNTLTCTAYYLATHPEVQDRLIREIDELKETSGDMPLYDMVQKAGYMDQVICEVLRLSGPDFLLARQCEEDSIYKGIKFPKGIGVNIPTYALHRDPDLWDNPLEFNPDNFSPEAKEKRDPFAFLPFGVGPRQCIGMRLAMLEIKIGLLQVMQRFKFERAPETVGKLEQQAVLIMSPKETIYVKIKARKQI